MTDIYFSCKTATGNSLHDIVFVWENISVSQERRLPSPSVRLPNHIKRSEERAFALALALEAVWLLGLLGSWGCWPVCLLGSCAVWSVGLLGCGALGAIGLLGCCAVGLLVYLAVGLVGYDYY